MTGQEKRRLATLIRRPTGKRNWAALLVVVAITSAITSTTGPEKSEAGIWPSVGLLALAVLLFVGYKSDQKFLAKFSEEQIEEFKASQEKIEARAKQASEAKVKEFDDNYGKCVLDDRFGLKKIRIYANGYVRITGGISDKGMDTPEKLVAVASNTDRMVARGNKGGNVLAGAILTIVTSETSYTIKAVTNSDDLFDTPGSLASLERILAVGNSVIK